MSNLKVHSLDKNGYKACENRSIPKEFRYKRHFDFTYSDVGKITCKKCKIAIGKPYFSDEYLFNMQFA